MAPEPPTLAFAESNIRDAACRRMQPLGDAEKTCASERRNVGDMRLRLPRSRVGWFLRCGVSIAIAAAGVGLSLGFDHYWQSKIAPVPVVGGGYPPITAPAFDSIAGDLLFAAMPFFALAVVTLLLGARVFALLAVGLLVVLTLWEYRTNAHDSSSTASLVFLWSWFGGVPLAIAAGVADTAWPWLKSSDRPGAPA